MAIQTGQGGEMRIVLRVKDDGTAVIEKFGDTSEKTAKKSSKAFDDFSSGAGLSFKSVATYAGIAAAAAVAVGVAMVKSAIDSAEATGKLAQRLGTTSEAISALTYAANLANISQQELAQQLRFMGRNLSNAAQGFGDAKYALADLGLNAQKLAKMKPEDAIAAISDALAKVPNAYDRARIEQDLFGRSSAEIDHLLRRGSGALREWYAEAQKAGVIIGTDAANAAMHLDDNIKRLNANLEGMAQTISGPVVYALLRMTDAMRGEESLDLLNRQRAMLANQYLAVANSQSYAMQQLKQNILKEIDELDAKIIEKNRALAKTLPAPGTAAAGAGGNLPNSRALEEQKKKIAEELKQLQDRTADDAENRARQYVKDFQTLQASLKLKLIAQEQYQAQSVGLADRYEADLADIAMKDPAFQAGEKLTQALQQERVARQTALIARVDDLKGTLQTEQQNEEDNYARQIATLYEGWNTIIQIDEEGNTARLVSDQQFKQMREQIELEHQAKLGNATAQGVLARQQFEKKTMMQQTQFVIGQLLEMTNGVATHNKTMFQINKAAGIANAIINTYLGVTKALSAYPPPWSLAMAAIQLAAGLAQVQQISSTQFGSATSAPSIAGGSATPTFSADSNFGPANTPAPAAASAPTTTVQINIQGNVLGNEEFVRDTLIPALRAEINGRDIVFINSNSRQAQELAA